MKGMSSLVSAPASASQSVTTPGTLTTVLWYAESWDTLVLSRYGVAILLLDESIRIGEVV